MAFRKSIDHKFWDVIVRDEDSGCWWFMGTRDYGYGRLYMGARRREMAHRFAYEMLVGPIPEGLTIDHLCSVRNCVNPAHLEPVTLSENARRAKAIPTCFKGHPYTPDDTRMRVNARGVLCRTCPTCLNERQRKASLRRRRPPLALDDAS